MKTDSSERSTRGVSLVLIGIFVGIAIGAIAALIYSNRLVKQYFLAQQDIELADWYEAAWKAYSSASPDVAKWALTNYLNKLDEVYSLRPAKNEDYYYSNFKGHARLARLDRSIHDTNSENAQISLALESLKRLESLKKFSEAKTPDSNYMFETIEKVDETERAVKSRPQP
jgi:hypothetical protein